MKEQVIQTKIQNWLKAQGFYVVKVVTATRAGVPDLLVCAKGRFIGLEVKTATGKTSPLQDYNIKEIKKSGGVAYVVRSVEGVRALFKREGLI